jgi:cobalamin synthase
MSLTTIGTAFILVAVVVNAAGMATARWAIRAPGSGGRGPGPELLARAVWPGATFEALVLTLLAALWFGSLGHGGWVILFLLLGALPAGDRWLRRRLAGAPAGGEARLFVASLLKYLLAGLVCVWRLT